MVTQQFEVSVVRVYAISIEADDAITGQQQLDQMDIEEIETHPNLSAYVDRVDYIKDGGTIPSD